MVPHGQENCCCGQRSQGEIQVESLSDLNNVESAQKIAEHFSSISNEYLPINKEQLPSYLPVLAPPQVTEFDVYTRLQKLKRTKSTLAIDIPERLRRECSPFLAAPLSSIFNDCLRQSVYPTLWKKEWVTPAPKITNPQEISDLRKISCTSDYSKLFEGFLKEWIIEDVSENVDIGQFVGQVGTRTEHLLVCFRTSQL